MTISNTYEISLYKNRDKLSYYLLQRSLSTLIKISTFIAAPMTALAEVPKPAPFVVQVYPSAESIPVNVLRFYIQFSQPMQEMDILKHIRLTDETGEDLTGVFYENQYELWNHNRTEVTLIVDPGRVKTGLKAHEKLGWAFIEGKRYQLTIDSKLLDFNNQPLVKNFTKSFVAKKQDTQRWLRSFEQLNAIYK